MISSMQNRVTDDQELAKVLAGISDSAPATTDTAPAESGLHFEETPVHTDDAAAPAADTPVADAPAEGPVLPEPVTASEEKPAEPTPAAEAEATIPNPNPNPVPEPELTLPEPAIVPATSGGGSDLEDIKKDALKKCVLVDKLDLPADEKFDTMLNHPLNR